jgi:hypothetical protein
MGGEKTVNITPSVAKTRLAEIPFSAFRTREQIILAWNECAPLPEGGVYQVCYKTNLTNDWSVYAETVFLFMPIPTTNDGLHMFSVRVRVGENFSDFAGRECAQ